MSHVLQNMYGSDQSGLWWMQRRLARRRPRSLCWWVCGVVKILDYKFRIFAEMWSRIKSFWHVPDENECSRDPSPCQEDQYCLNTDGSYSCKGSQDLCSELRKIKVVIIIMLIFVFSLTACGEACSGCTGPGADQCQSCAGGYQDSEGTCTGTADNYILRSSGNLLKACIFLNSFEWIYFLTDVSSVL